MNIKKLKKGPRSIYSDSLISTVCQELLSGNLSMTEARRKYGVKSDSTIRVWIANFQNQYGSNLAAMEPTGDDKTQGPPPAEEAQELKARCKQLEAALELARLENFTLHTLIDIADEQLHTDIRKKSGAKQ